MQADRFSPWSGPLPIARMGCGTSRSALAGDCVCLASGWQVSLKAENRPACLSRCAGNALSTAILTRFGRVSRISGECVRNSSFVSGRGCYPECSSTAIPAARGVHRRGGKGGDSQNPSDDLVSTLSRCSLTPPAVAGSIPDSPRNQTCRKPPCTTSRNTTPRLIR